MSDELLTTDSAPPPMLAQPSNRNPLAVVSLVCGLVLIGGITWILAIVFGIIALHKTRTPGVRGRGLAIAGMVLGLIGLVVVGPFVLLPSVNLIRGGQNRNICARNEQRIGEALHAFADNNQGQYPGRLGDLIVTGNISQETFICPDSGKKAPADWETLTAAERVAWIDANTDYVYVRPGPHTLVGSKTILLYEKDADHHSAMNILYGDGRVEYVLLAEAHKRIGR